MLSRNVSVTRALARSLTHAQKLDPVQEALLSEPCLLVDTEDRVLGPASKRACHEVSDVMNSKIRPNTEVSLRERARNDLKRFSKT